MRRLSLVLAATLFFAACAPAPTEEVEQSEGSIVDVQHTPIERQTIGNCGPTPKQGESMHLAATGNDRRVAVLLTYWHWFSRSAAASATRSARVVGRARPTRSPTTRVVKEMDFVAADCADESSATQAAALAMINMELKTGRLKDGVAAPNRTTVREVMDEAWASTAGVQT